MSYPTLGKSGVATISGTISSVSLTSSSSSIVSSVSIIIIINYNNVYIKAPVLVIAGKLRL